MKLFLSPGAKRRLREIQAHLAYEASLQVALRVILRIRQSTGMLADHPQLGARWQGGPARALRGAGLPCRIHSRITGDMVEIITIAHIRQRPPRFGPERD